MLVTHRAALKVGARIEVRGRENLPTSGPLVLVSNHASHLDAPALLAALPLRRALRTSAAAARDYFFESLPRALAAALLTNALPFDRHHQCGQCLRRCQQTLRDDRDGALIIFPEGTRSIDGTIGEFKRGVGEVVAGTTIPVVPCFIDGAFRTWPRHRGLPRLGKVRVTIGRPRRYAQFPRGNLSSIAIADDLRNAVIHLCSENQGVLP